MVGWVVSWSRRMVRREVQETQKGRDDLQMCLCLAEVHFEMTKSCRYRGLWGQWEMSLCTSAFGWGCRKHGAHFEDGGCHVRVS
jgi:hypothetical protein